MRSSIENQLKTIFSNKLRQMGGMKILHSTFPSWQDCLTRVTVQDLAREDHTHFSRDKIENFHSSGTTNFPM